MIIGLRLMTFIQYYNIDNVVYRRLEIIILLIEGSSECGQYSEIIIKRLA